MLKKTSKASFTVEAAFVLPIIVFVIFAFLYLGMYLHDRVCIQTILDRYGTRAQDTIRVVGRKETQEQLSKDISKEMKTKLCIISLENMKITVGLLMIHMEYVECKQFRLPGIELLFGEKKQRKKKIILIYNPMEGIRSMGGFLKDDSGV